MEFDKTLTSGSTKLLLMKLLEQQDMYGYQMIEELRRRSDHTFDLKSGTLYPLLHSLEQAGWVTAREEPTASGRTRRYYHLTGSGREQNFCRNQIGHTFGNLWKLNVPQNII